jgi:murein DD-endopeptidase MepM/ murein hydrolase activator NlpD
VALAAPRRQLGAPRADNAGAMTPRTPFFDARSPRRTLTAVALAVALLAPLTLTGVQMSSAQAAEYPTWADVVAARENQALAAAQAEEIRALLVTLQEQATEAEETARAKGNALAAAEQAFDDAHAKAEDLKAQAAQAEEEARIARQRAALLIADMARNGVNLTEQMMFSSSGPERLLARLGFASKLGEQSQGIYDAAIIAQRRAERLGRLADAAVRTSQTLKVAAEKALEEAVEAQQASERAVAEADARRAEMEYQLELLITARSLTEIQYEDGVEAARRLAEEAARRLVEEAARRAAAEAAARAGLPSQPGGQVLPSGWSRPSSGSISSPYGYRIHPITGDYRMHAGIDLDADCWAPVYAAYSGTVGYTGWYGTYGNFIRIDHGSSISTAYAHIVEGGIAVAFGQKVDAGQIIAYVGSTGGSTGCHLHYEVRSAGVAVDPIPFMLARGVTFV